MSISAGVVRVDHGLMEKAMHTAVSPASGRGSVTRLSRPRPVFSRRENDLDRARAARNGLRPRSERFAHLKRMYD